MKYAIEYYNYLLVIFYFPWNRKYDYIIPELIKANYIIEDKGLPYKIGKVDLLINEVMREKNSFIFYPTYIFFIKGKNCKKSRILKNIGKKEVRKFAG